MLATGLKIHSNVGRGKVSVPDKGTPDITSLQSVLRGYFPRPTGVWQAQRAGLAHTPTYASSGRCRIGGLDVRRDQGVGGGDAVAKRVPAAKLCVVFNPCDCPVSRLLSLEVLPLPVPWLWLPLRR